MPLLFLGIAAIGWAVFSLVPGKGRYIGCPSGGLDRVKDPFGFWAPTLILLCIGICLLLIFFAVIPLPSRS